ncbi:MAG: GntR family transcriptional regulator [Hyphomicrobiales bacterium]
MGKGRVGQIYRTLREMTVNFSLRPGERINEVALARELGVSRTPLREALNRLVAESFIDFEPGRGFVCRKLSVADVYDLYQMRIAVETFSVRMAVEKASDNELARIADFWEHASGDAGYSLEQMLAYDEHFHESIAALTENKELMRTLKNINARIRFFRWVDMEERRPRTRTETRDIIAAMQKRDADNAVHLMQAHISRRSDEIADALKECYAKLFLDGDFVEPRFVEKVDM